MENKRLNLNQPLLSVRRGSSIMTVPEVNSRKTNDASPTGPSLPYYKSELKSGPIRNPGVVPFQWEQIPGRPKDETRDSLTKDLDQPLQAPKFPTGRVMNHLGKNSDKHSKDSCSSKPQFAHDTQSVSEAGSLHKNAMEFDESEDDKEENGSSNSGDENSTYLDALDTLSRTDSFLNCSFSGVSGLEGHTGVRSNGTSSDPQARDFIIDRFLPAAHEVASDTPHPRSRKQSVLKEEPRGVKKIITRDKGNPQNHYMPESVVVEKVEDGDDEEEEYDFDGTKNFSSAKLCGLLPRFCLLNPIPGMRDPVPVPASSFRKIYKKPANTGAHVKNENKAIMNAVYEGRRLAVYKRSNMRAGNGASNLKDELKNLPFQIDSSMLHKALATVNCDGINGTSIPPYRSSSRSSLMQKEKGFLGIPEASGNSWPIKRISNKRNNRFHKLLTTDQNQSAKAEPSPLANPTTVKTLYVDSAQGAEYQDSNSSSSDSRSLSDSRGRNPSIDYSLQDISDLCAAADGAISHSSNLEPVDHSALYLETSNCAQTEGKLKDCQQMRDPKPHSLSLTSLNLQDSHDQGFSAQKLKEEDSEDIIMQDTSLILPPPWPKSPSESWLSRALPSASSKGTHYRANFGVGNQDFSAFPATPQWENTIKSTSAHHKRPGLPALTPVPEN